MARHSSPTAKGRLISLFRTSLILSAIDRFTQIIYSALKNGFFGTLLSAYPTRRVAEDGGILYRIGAPLRRYCAKTVEQSFFIHLFSRFTRFFLRCRTRVYGTFFLTFGIYTAAGYLLQIIGEEGRAPTSTLVIALILCGISLPLITSDIALADALRDSRLAAPILAFIGIRREILHADKPAGRSNLALIFGMAAGVISFFLSPLLVVGGLIGLVLLYRIFVTPELGVVLLFFGMPFLPTMALAGAVIYTSLCLAVKLLLGKRRLRLEAVDIAAIAVAFSLGCGGVFSFSSGSLKPTLLLICLLCGYFLTVLLIRNRQWLAKCALAATVAATLVAAYGILQYFSGSLASAGAWLDANMFENIAGRAISTLENPNMLAEYLILLLPLAVCRLIGECSAGQRSMALLSCGIIGACIILTWSRGAWLGLIFGAVVFLLIRSHRCLYLLLAGVISIPFLPFVLPDSIISRFTSIGNLADSSTSYRVNIWRGTIRMLEDYWITGIGVGEAAWGTVYPRYSLAAIETAPHAHNLYLQTWVQTGIVGLLLLTSFIILLLQCNFSYYRALSQLRQSVSDSALSARLSASPKEHAASSDLPESTVAQRKLNAMRMDAAAPLCGILATLLQGLTDYTWYNYRVYLMFWLMAGLSAAYVRSGRSEIRRLEEYSAAENTIGATEANVELPLVSAHAKSAKTPRKGKKPHA